MTTDLKILQITMELYETEISELQKFIANEKAGEFTGDLNRITYRKFFIKFLRVH